MQRGDLLFLTMPRSTPLRDGDITVYKVPGAPIPIVHRVIEAHNELRSVSLRPVFCLSLPLSLFSLSRGFTLHRIRLNAVWNSRLTQSRIRNGNRPDGADQWILTKGDNNPVDDVGLYRGLKYLKRSHITGKVQAYVPRRERFPIFVRSDRPGRGGKES